MYAVDIFCLKQYYHKVSLFIQHRKCPAPPPTQWSDSRSTLLLFVGGNLGVLQNQWVLIFCNIRQCESFLIRLQGPPRPNLKMEGAGRGGNGKQICGGTKNSGFLESLSYAVIAKSCLLSSR